MSPKKHLPDKLGSGHRPTGPLGTERLRHLANAPTTVLSTVGRLAGNRALTDLLTNGPMSSRAVPLTVSESAGNRSVSRLVASPSAVPASAQLSALLMRVEQAGPQSDGMVVQRDFDWSGAKVQERAGAVSRFSHRFAR
jgi:hypothetical protein